MGFTSGFVSLLLFSICRLTLTSTLKLGGVALTSSVLYLTVAIHRQNRNLQSTHIRQQDGIFRNILDPQPPAPPPTAREVRAGLFEMSKDGWNRKVEQLVQTVTDTDWNEVRSELEKRLHRTAEGVSQKVADSLPQTEIGTVVQKREG
jgi:altered-inheritance-of-mitochondria protein 5